MPLSYPTELGPAGTLRLRSWRSTELAPRRPNSCSLFLMRHHFLTCIAVLAWTAAALSGFSALVFEVAFTRLLALVIGPTTYAFATMAASFITGLAIGSTAGARLSRKVSRPAYWH